MLGNSVAICRLVFHELAFYKNNSRTWFQKFFSNLLDHLSKIFFTCTIRDMTSVTTPERTAIAYLSEVIEDISLNKRAAFIRALRDALALGVFDGSPLADHFELSYEGRGPKGKIPKTQDQREYAFEKTPAFEMWFAERQHGSKASQFPKREMLESGEITLKELAAIYRKKARRTPVTKKR
jgi:hypothetical protein